MRKITRNTWMAASLVCASMLFVGCESKLTQENYTRLKPGMTLVEVQNILGSSGTEDTSSGGLTISGDGMAGSSKEATDKIYVWEEDGVKIIVILVDGKVVSTSQSGL